jgi:hypothetical protein
METTLPYQYAVLAAHAGGACQYGLVMGLAIAACVAALRNSIGFRDLPGASIARP